MTKVALHLHWPCKVFRRRPSCRRAIVRRTTDDRVICIKSWEARAALLAGLLKSIVRKGNLTVIDWRGRESFFGDPWSNLHATIRLHDTAAAVTLALNPSLALGKAYMDGRLSIGSPGSRSLS